MTRHGGELPVVRRLPDSFRIEEGFSRLVSRPHCLWLDSASRGPRNGRGDGGDQAGRYSFLMADPIQTLVASVDDPNPWPTFEAWCRSLPGDFDPSLPPFQGGIAGLIGYESAAWLEPVGLARTNDLPTSAISLGLYDWTIATDHQSNQSWIVSQGFGTDNRSKRQALANRRADQVQAMLAGPVDPIKPPERPVDPSLLDRYQSTPHAGVVSNFSSDGFRAAVEQIVRGICDGDSFQVNLAQRLVARAHSASHEVYRRLRRVNAAPFGAYYDGGDFQVLSSSPEGFLQVRDRCVHTRPIKGTVARTGDTAVDDKLADQLRTSEKDRAENVMIVDLMRNDLSRVCNDEMVSVGQLCKVERYEFVQHLVSVVEGRLRDDKSIGELVRACFPGGSVTGAPKIEAMRTIARLEPCHRGPYCGSIGYVSCGGSADFNILIRTITAAHGYWQIPVGGGITARSDPWAEEAETWAKAEGMLRAIRSE